MSNSTICAVLFLHFVFMISCSTTQQAATPTEAAEASIYPDWYSSSDEFVDADSVFTAYGMALGSDSTAAARKALVKAKANFEQHLSSKLESIRNDAIDELGEGSGLESTSFIFALRQVEGSISEATSVEYQEAKPNSGFDSYQGFSSDYQG